MKRAALAIVPALFVLGCTESDHNPFIVRVTSVNNGSTLLADVVATDGTIPTELPPVVLSNRPYSSSVVVDETNYALDYQVNRYTVTFRATQGTPGGLSLGAFTHTEAVTTVVPINGSATLGMLIVPLSMKIAPPFVALQTGGQIPLIADIDIEGSPAINPNETIHVHASLSVVFANFADAE